MFTDGSFQLAIDSYRQGNLSAANHRFSYIVDISPEHWEARLYLAMTQIRLGNDPLGIFHMRYLVDHCPDPSIRWKAELSLATLRGGPQPGTSTTGSAAGTAGGAGQDEVEIVWRDGKKSKGLSGRQPIFPKIKRRFFWQR